MIPHSENAVVLRTDFSDEAEWEAVCAAIRTPFVLETPPGIPSETFEAHVEFVNDQAFDGLASEQLLKLIPEGSDHTFIFVVDRETLRHKDRPILVIDLYREPGRAFRVIPSEMWSVENNLSIANMDFEEFADATDEDGIFRGFH